MDNPINVVIFGSGSGTNLEALLKHQLTHSHLYAIKLLFADRPCRFLEIGQQNNIPTHSIDFKSFFNDKDKNNPHHRDLYDIAILEILKEHLPIDLIILAGYMRMIYPPLLNAFPNKIINVHPGDLTVTDSEGKRKYVGSNAVLAALSDGQNRTRSTVFTVNAGMDEGAILSLGPYVPYTEGEPITQEKALRHQQKQKRLSDWPALTQTVETIAQQITTGV